MITIYSPTGAPAQIAPEALPVWVAKGWSTEQLAEADTPTSTELDLSATLHTTVASTQPSDVTAPGESEIEGVAPKAQHATQDEE